MPTSFTSTPKGTTVVTPGGTNFYANLGNQDSAFPSDPNAPVATPVTPVTTPVVAPTYTAPTSGTANVNPNPGIVSATAATNSLATDGNALDKMTNQPDPYLEALQKNVSSLQGTAATGGEPGVEEKNAAMQGGRLQQKTEQDFTAYKAGLETLGIQSGLSRYAPGLQADKMINAANAETTKLGEIQDKENLAIAKAKQARINNNAVELKAALAEVRQYKQDKATEMQRMLGKRTQDITVANAVAPHLADALKGLDAKHKEAMILQTAKENNVNPSTLVDALTREADVQRKFDLTTALQLKALNKIAGGGGGKGSTPASSKPLSTAALNFLKKNDPMIDIGFGDTPADAEAAIMASDAIKKGVEVAHQNPDLVDDKGYLTAEYVKNALTNLPAGINRDGFLTTIKDKLYLNKYKYAKDYGISKGEFDKLTGE